MAVLLVLIAWLNLGTLLLTSLFGYFALHTFSIRRQKYLGLAIYIVVVAAIGAGMVYFSQKAYETMPKIADTSIPAVVGFAEKNGIELPFTDYESLKSLALDKAREGIAGVGRYVRAATFQFVLILVGLVVAASLFMNPSWVKNDPQTAQDSLYATITRELAVRFTLFYQSFSRVMGAQLLISIINTGLTSTFLILNHFPFTAVLVALTFLCGLLPILGNLISNVLIVGVGFTLSPKTALFAFIFLVAIHKLEYFLNSKVVGDRIKNPVWLTLIGLILGEKLMGIPGMVLAPVVLYYIKLETSQNQPNPSRGGQSVETSRPKETASASIKPTTGS